jgi:hypothetical protein
MRTRPGLQGRDLHIGALKDDCFLDCYNPEQLNYVKQIIVILLRNMAGARTSMEMYCYKLGCYLTFDNSGCKSGRTQLCRGCHFGPQIGQPRRYAGRIGALGYLGGCRFAGRIDKNKKFFESAWTHVGLLELLLQL